MKQLSNNPVTSRSAGDAIDDVLGEEEASVLNSRKITTVAIFGSANRFYGKGAEILQKRKRS